MAASGLAEAHLVQSRPALSVRGFHIRYTKLKDSAGLREALINAAMRSFSA